MFIGIIQMSNYCRFSLQERMKTFNRTKNLFDGVLTCMGGKGPPMCPGMGPM